MFRLQAPFVPVLRFLIPLCHENPVYWLPAGPLDRAEGPPFGPLGAFGGDEVGAGSWAGVGSGWGVSGQLLIRMEVESVLGEGGRRRGHS